MIQLLFLVVLIESAVVLVLMVKMGPVRELVMKGLEQMKMNGKGPATVKTVGCTLGAILISSLTSVFKIQNKGAKIGTLTPMDQVLWRTHLLEASLNGYSLFLGYVIDRLHHYLCKLKELKDTVEVSNKEVQRLQTELKEKEEGLSKEIKLLKDEISSLKESKEKLKMESKEKDRRMHEAGTLVAALQKQLEDLLLEYDRLVEDNQALQCQTLGYKI